MFWLQEAFVEIIVGRGVVFFALIGQNRFLAILQIIHNLGMDVLASDDEAVGIVDGTLGEGEVVGLFEALQVLGVDARQLHFLLKARTEFLIKSIVVNGVNHL